MERELRKIYLPPSRICQVCQNLMNDLCIKECASRGKLDFFLPDPKRPLSTLPRLTLEEFRQLSLRTRGEWIFFRMERIIEFLEGREEE